MFSRIRKRTLIFVTLVMGVLLVPLLIFMQTFYFSAPAKKDFATSGADGGSSKAAQALTFSRPARNGADSTVSTPWSDKKTWGGTLPGAQANVEIPKGQTIILDVSPPPLKSLTINGTLKCAERDLALTADRIMIQNTGRFECGSEAAPFQHRAVITLTSSNPSEDAMGMGTKLLGVLSATLELHGLPRTSWTHLNATAPAGSTQIVLEQASGWYAGDRIVLASTDYNPSQSEEMTIVGVSGTTVTLDKPLKYMHWGQLQTFAGRMLDERAEVGLLSHNIVIQGDASSAATGFGGQTMIMHGGTAHIEGVEFYHMGQQQRLGHYPLHWHLVGDAPNSSYARNNSIDHSFNRCITLHGTNNVLLQSNVAFDTIGHCYFFEDGIETNNTLLNNLGLDTHKPKDGGALIPTDTRPATFWVTNPYNTLKGNVAAGSQGIGFWYAFPEHPTGFSQAAVNVWPRHTPLGVFSDNVAHSNDDTGLNVDGGPKLDGTSETTYYEPRQSPTLESTDITADFKNFTAYKQRQLGVWFRGKNLRLTGALLADNTGGAIFAAQETFVQDSLFIGESANKGTPEHWEKIGLDGRSLPQPWAPETPISGYSFYDGRVGAQRVTFVNFQSNSQRPASGLSYLRSNHFPLDPRNFAQGLRFINANSVYMENPHADHDGDKSAVFIDADGSVTGKAGQYVVVKNPFLVESGCSFKTEWNTNICGNPYINIQVGSDSGEAVVPLTIGREDGASVSQVGIPGNGSYISSTILSGHSYTLKFSGATPVKLRLRLNDLGPNDWALLAVPYNSAPSIVYRDYNRSQPIKAASSLNSLKTSKDAGYYYDSGAKMFYARVMPQEGRDWATIFTDPQ